MPALRGLRQADIAKSEGRIPKSEVPIRKLGFRPSNFGLLSDLGLRISAFD
jgi:hypothetical protein